MVAARSLRKRLRNLPQAKPEPVFMLVHDGPNGELYDHWTGERVEVPETTAPVFILRLGPKDESEVEA